MWVGRYRCNLCGSFGYWGRLTVHSSNAIRPYICAEKGCGANAIRKIKHPLGKDLGNKAWRCGKHSTKENEDDQR